MGESKMLDQEFKFASKELLGGQEVWGFSAYERSIIRAIFIQE